MEKLVGSVPRTDLELALSVDLPGHVRSLFLYQAIEGGISLQDASRHIGRTPEQILQMFRVMRLPPPRMNGEESWKERVAQMRELAVAANLGTVRRRLGLSYEGMKAVVEDFLPYDVFTQRRMKRPLDKASVVRHLRDAEALATGHLSLLAYIQVCREHPRADGVEWGSLYAICRSYGSWNAALREAGIPEVHQVQRVRDRISEEECLGALMEAAEILGKIPTLGEYERVVEDNPQMPHATTIKKRLGSWAELTMRYANDYRDDRASAPATEKVLADEEETAWGRLADRSDDDLLLQSLELFVRTKGCSPRRQGLRREPDWFGEGWLEQKRWMKVQGTLSRERQGAIARVAPDLDWTVTTAEQDLTARIRRLGRYHAGRGRWSIEVFHPDDGFPLGAWAGAQLWRGVLGELAPTVKERLSRELPGFLETGADFRLIQLEDFRKGETATPHERALAKARRKRARQRERAQLARISGREL